MFSICVLSSQAEVQDIFLIYLKVKKTESLAFYLIDKDATHYRTAWIVFCFVWKKLFPVCLFTYAVLLGFFLSVLCFVLVWFFFFLFNLYQVLVLIICLKIVYITVTDYFFFNVQINLLNVNVLNLFRSLSDNRTYGADPRDVFYGVCMLNHDPTEINGILPVHFHEVKTSPQFE